MKRAHWFLLLASALMMMQGGGGVAARPTEDDGGGGITFTDIAAGIGYQHGSPDRFAILQALQDVGILSQTDIVNFPHKPRGIPGVAMLDFDMDGAMDVYVTNGPGVPNSLLRNQLLDNGSGTVSFVDVALEAGVAVTDQDSNAVCFGDFDNDGDPDLIVLNNEAPHSVFENLGDGTFADISSQSGITSLSGAVGCSMGDIDGDGLLDVVIANSFDQSTFLPIVAVPFALNIPDQLFRNQGGNVFTDVSFTSDIRELVGIPTGAATITWAASMVDYDLDGDIDILLAQDQAGISSIALDPVNGLDRGYIRVMQNDGTGHFVDVSENVGTSKFGAWMGFSFGDIDCNGYLDFFVTNFGDFGSSLFGEFPLRVWTSEWYLGQADKTFQVGDLGDLVTLPFGWGTSMLDYDNDGDTDIMFHGGIEAAAIVDASNPGVILQNQDCSATFTFDTQATSATDHSRRNVQGAIVGDLNNDGFPDVVSVSNFDIPATTPLLPVPGLFGGPFQDVGFFVPTWVPDPDDETLLQWTGQVFMDGSLSIEMNSADNGNHWVVVEVLGTKGLTTDGQVNRAGIGAVVTFTPRGGKTSMRPIVGGSSYASQDSLIANFGMGQAKRGTVEILWPTGSGGTRNRLYNVKHGERIIFPEIPCSFTATWTSQREYRQCVVGALSELRLAGIIDWKQKVLLFASAMRAYNDRT